MALSFDSGDTLADRMRAHAGDDTHLYGHLMRAMADDWEAGGPVREICRGWESSPEGSVVQLRLLAGLFRIVLTGRAPQLVAFYPCLGGTAAPEDAWPVVRDVLAPHVDELHEALDVAPQTNEVGRTTALLVGLFEAVRRSGLSRVRLLEPGASAGLGLLVDEFRFVNADWDFGPSESPLVIRDAFVGDVVPVEFSIVARAGCDLSPVDPTTEEGRLRLRSFVWPWQIERHERLNAALEIAARHPVTVDWAGAGEWLEQRLSVAVHNDVLTVVWHSVTRMYWPSDETERVLAALTDAGSRMALAHVAMEFPVEAGVDSKAVAALTLDDTTLARVGPHGIPVTMEV